MIKQSSIDNLKYNLDVVDVIGKYISLKKSGANYKCNCPFHGENTPSFVVSPSKQIYHCFGCNVTGDSISFVMEYEKLSYPEAIEKLADEYNINLEYDNKFKSINKQILEDINKFFVNNLDTNQTAFDYLVKRGVSLQSIEKFQIGYAPSNQNTMNFINNQHININDGVENGIIASGDNGYYCRFIERITFPIKDNSGKICAFGGRTISNHPAKYINSPTTKVFNKSKTFYGYYESKDKIFKSGEMIISEGYLDVIMLHQVGFENVVATCGTALTNEHIPLIKKSNSKIILAFDGDNAGIMAAFKASNLLIQHQLDSKVVIFEDAMDPADMVKNGQIDDIKNLFVNAKPSIKFCLDTIIKKYDINTPEDKQKAYKEANDFLLTLTDFLQNEYKPYLSSILNIDEKLIKTKMQIKANPQIINNNYKIENKREDFSELSIIKILIEMPNLIDSILDFVDSNMFYTHKEEFNLVLKNNLEHEKLIKIVLREEIKLINEDELKDNLILMQKKYYQNIIKNTLLNDLDFKKQIKIKKKINQAINRLKEYKLVKYENFFD